MKVTSQEGNSAAEKPKTSVLEANPAISGATFGPIFYLSVLPDRIKSQCEAQPENVPAVNLHLANGRILDLCHIIHLDERWLAVQYFRDAETCADMDVAFLPYELVVLVTVSIHHPETRGIGFNVEELASTLGSH